MRTGDFGPLVPKGPAYRWIRAADRVPTYAELRDEDPMLRVRLFNPQGAGTWWIAAFDPDPEGGTNSIAYGVAEIQEREIGSFSLDELAHYRGPFGLPIERDLHFEPCRMSEVAG
jgi:hypothetical protein